VSGHIIPPPSNDVSKTNQRELRIEGNLLKKKKKKKKSKYCAKGIKHDCLSILSIPWPRYYLDVSEPLYGR
jgi:hypothetical protein